MQQIKVASICFCVVLLLILVLFLPITAKAKIYVNLVDLRAYYVVKILGIKLLCGYAKIENSKLVFNNTHNKIIKQDKESQKKEGLFIRQIIKNIATHKLDLFFEFGSKDASISALVCGYAQIIFSFLCAHVLNFNNYSHVFEAVVADYNKESCELAMQIIVGLSIFKIIKSKLIANKLHRENTSGN